MLGGTFGTSTSPRAGPSTSRDDNGDGGAGGQNPCPGKKDDGGEEEVAIDNWTVCPKPDEEPTSFYRLSGNTMSGFTEVCGWTLQNPLKFNNIHASTKFKDMCDPKGNFVKAADELKSKCITLAEMRDLIGCPGQANCPVYVQVVAKRKVNVLVFSNRLLVIPLIVVADASGYCVLCSFNEGLETIHKSVDVGDFILVSACLPQPCRRTFHKGLFSETMFLDLEMKVQYHTVRNHYLRKFDTSTKLSDFRFPAALFDDSCHLKIPSELEKEFQSTEKPPWVTPPEAEQYYDIIGLISYVSRIERFRQPESNDMECLVDNEIKLQPFIRYVTYRWIHLIDQESKPFPLKLYNLSLDSQDNLVPGAIVIISHCQTTKTEFSIPYSSTSQFSEIYSGSRIETYYMLHPASFYAENAKKICNRSNYINTISRKDFSLSIGGTLTIKILSEERFREWFLRSVNPNDNYYDVPHKLARRESCRLHVRGTIIRAFKVHKEDSPLVYYVHERYREIKQQMAKYKVSGHHLPYGMFRNVTWYSFMRKLPSINQNAFQFSKCRHIVNEIVKSFKGYCGPLLMPAEIDNQKLPPMADLEIVDGAPYFLLDIVNEESCHWYRCIWKSFHYTIEEMTEKVDLAKGKQIMGLAEKFCVEERAPLEVNLHDFVIDDVE